ELFRTIQSHLFTISALAATSSRSEQFKSLTTLGEKEIHWLELTQKTLMEKITIEPRFYYSDEICAPLEISRTLCRRCERRVVTCIRERGKSELIASQKYLNRLSDFLWVYARSIS
ncbi:MAG: ATP:cob(I)alamin adenosyltransferase, partial [Spirochaetales bacterium]|nr:ATP:cob(I)alamin adenosyltransferase [Spirochaetales bacterium]